MGGLPPFIFVVRHGNRLDAADKRWHITSPTPYDPPLTYAGFLQARQVGAQIATILEQAKVEQEACQIGPASTRKRKRFKVVIHSSPFLRCVQTSIGISSGLAQTSSDSPHHPSDVFVAATGPTTRPGDFHSAILRLDPFLGEWLSPEYFEMITPPPGAALMVGSAKAELLRREDYSTLATTHQPVQQPTRSSSLWSGSPGASPSINAMQPTAVAEREISAGASAMAAALSGQLANQALQKKGYAAPRPNYAISTSGKIPDGFVAHARDECVVVDYQWDSMREPLDFGDGGQFGEEWTTMHKRFRKGVKKMLNWYATAEAPDEMVTRAAGSVGADHHTESHDDEEVETVVILVSHGAGCNALIGAITHQPVLMDVGIASITMAVRKQGAKYEELLKVAEAESDSPSLQPQVSPHQVYDIRMSASTDHLRSTSSTPVSARSSADNIFAPSAVTNRGRAPSLGEGNGPIMGSFVYTDPVIPHGSRSTSASASLGSLMRRDSGSRRPPSRSPALATGGAGPRSVSPVNGPSSFGLWSPRQSSLRLIDGADDESDKEDFDSVLPNFGGSLSFKSTGWHRENAAPPVQIPGPAPTISVESIPEPPMFSPSSAPERTELPPSAIPSFTPFSVPSIITSPSPADFNRSKPRGPILAAPIRLRTDVDFDHKPEEDFSVRLGEGLGGLWGLPRPPGEAERMRDLSLSKRRWTTTERAQI